MADANGLQQGGTEEIRMEERMKQLRNDSRIAGTPFLFLLHAIGIQVFQLRCFKEVFAGLLVLCLLLSGFWLLAVALLSGAVAAMATFHRGPLPPSIPLAPPTLDVLLGRPTKVSQDAHGLDCNNNVSITAFGSKYVLAYRQSDVHFPSAKTQMVVANSEDLTSWRTVWTYVTGQDIREMLLIELRGQLLLYFFTLKPSREQFKPLNVFVMSSQDGSQWAHPEATGYEGEVPWEIKLRRGGGGAGADDSSDLQLYKTSYLGDHYGTEPILVLFQKSMDGKLWTPVDPASSSSVVYKGGVSEVSFEFTASGDLVAIGRNEDGDKTGFGTQLFHARAGSLGTWTSLPISLPYRFDSPRLVSSTTEEILLFARCATCRYQLAPEWLPLIYRKAINLIAYSLLPKSSAVFRLAPRPEWGSLGHGAVQLIRHFEHCCGDTGFFSAVREIGADEASDSWVVANYSSTTCHSHAPWIYGQLHPSHVFAFRCRLLKLPKK